MKELTLLEKLIQAQTETAEIVNLLADRVIFLEEKIAELTEEESDQDMYERIRMKS